MSQELLIARLSEKFLRASNFDSTYSAFAARSGMGQHKTKVIDTSSP